MGVNRQSGKCTGGSRVRVGVRVRVHVRVLCFVRLLTCMLLPPFVTSPEQEH